MTDAGATRRNRGRPRSTTADAPSGTVQALDRGLHLLRLVAAAERITLTELALSAGMPASSAHRLLVTLQKHAFLEFNEATQEWMIGVEAFRVGSALPARASLVDASREVMRRLCDEMGETANLGICHDGDVVFVGQAECHNPIRAFFRPGTRGPLHASGIGKALLAVMSREEVSAILESKGLPAFTPKTITASAGLFKELDIVRARGWAFDDEERYLGMRCVAAPVFNSYAEAVGGISISGPSVRFAEDAIAEIGPRIRRAAQEVTERIGGTGPSTAGHNQS